MSSSDIAVMIVDDDRQACENLADWLRRREKVFVRIALSGEEALEILHRDNQRYDIVLLDQIFPQGMDGLQALQRIKSDCPETFVVMLTADAGEAGMEALRQGAYRYISKPVVDNQEIGFLVRHVGEIRELERRLHLEHQLGEAAGRMAERLTTLLKHEQEISRLALLGDYDRLANHITLAVGDLTGTDVSLWVIDETPDGPMLRIKAGRGLSANYQQTATLSLDPTKSIVAACLREKHPLVKVDIFDDTASPPFHYKRQAKIQGWQSFLAVPLLDSTERPLGALSVYSRQKRDFSDEEKSLLLAFANQAAIALETRARQTSLEQLVRSGQITVKEVAAEAEVLNQFVELACQLTGAPCAAIYPYDPQREEFYDAGRVAVAGLIRKKKISRKPRRKGLAAIVRHTGLVVVHNLDAGDIDDTDYGQIQEQTPLDRERLLEIIRAEKFVKRERIKAFVGISLHAAEDTGVVQDQAAVGVLYVNFRAPHHFSNSELSLIQLFAQQVASLIRAARLRAGLREQLRIRSILAEASNAIAQAVERDDILEAVFRQVFRLLTGKETGSVMAVEADGRLRIVDSLGASQENLAAFHSRPTYAHEGSFGSVTRTGRIFESRNTARDLKTGRMLDVGLFIPPQVTNVPLKCEGKVAGILVVDTVASHPQMKEALLALAEVGGMALERANRARTLSELNEAGKALTAAPNLASVMNGVVERAETILQAEAVVLYLYDRKRNDVVLPPVMRGVRQPEILESGAFSGDSVSTRIIRSGKSQYAPNSPKNRILSGMPRPTGTPVSFVQREGIASSAGVLLRGMSEIVGILFVNYRTRHAFGKAEREKIELFAGQAAVAIQNAVRLEQTDVLRKQAEALKNISEDLSSALTPQGVAKKVLDGLKQVIDYRKATFQLLYDRDKPRTIIGYRGFGKEAIDPSLLKPVSQDSLIGGIVASGAPLILSKTRDNCPPWFFTPSTADVESWVGIPVKWAGGVRGLITLDHEQPGYYTDTMANLLVSVAGQAAVAIERAEAMQAVLRRIGIIEKVAQVISSELDVENLMQTIVRQVAKTLRCTHCTLFLAETLDGEGWLVPKKTHGSRPEVLTRSFRTDEGLAGLVYQTGKSIVLSDARAHPRFAAARDEQNRPRSMLVVPIKVGDQTIGVISADQDEFAWFSDDDRRLLDALAQQIGTAIQRSVGLNLLQEVGNRIVSSQDESSVIQEIISGAIRLTNTYAGTIFLLNESSQAVSKEYHYPSEFSPPQPRLNTGEGLTAEIVRTRQPIKIPDFDQYPDVNPGLRDLEFRALIGVPMQLDGKVTAVLLLYDRDIHRFSEVETSLLSILADQAAIAIKNARLYAEIESRATQLRILLDNNERFITQGVKDTDHLLDLLYKVACEVMDLSDAQVQFALYDTEKNEVTFPLAVEQDDGHEIDKIRWGERDAKYRKDGEDKLVQAFMPRQHGSRFGLTEYVIQTKEPILIAEDFWRTASALRVGEVQVRVLPRFGKLERPTHSWLGVPMIAQGRVIGIISIQSLEQEHAFTQEQVDLLTVVANQAAVAIENATLYAKLKDAVQRVAEAERLATMSDLAAEFGHRMNNLAGTIPIRVSLIEEKLNQSTRRDPVVLRELKGLRKDANQLLDASKEIKQSTEFRPAEAASINNLLDIAIDRVRHSQPEIGKVTFHKDFALNLPSLVVERNKLLEMFVNIIRNGVQAMPNGGTLTVTSRLSQSADRPSIEIVVTDTGVGISEEDLPRIFTLFFTTKPNGLGYGLWRDQNFVRRLGGNIDVKSKAGQGATFTIRLPANQGQDVEGKGNTLSVHDDA